MNDKITIIDSPEVQLNDSIATLIQEHSIEGGSCCAYVTEEEVLN